MRLLSILFAMGFLVISVAPADAFWWMVYHKPAFKGRVIDAETKSPIEGAVVVVAYYKTSANPPAGANDFVINVREVLTGKDGEFYFPSYTTIVQPLAIEGPARFIIFKPGYGNYPNQQNNPPLLWSADEERFFSKYEIGEQGSVQIAVKAEERGPGLMEIKNIRLAFGVVELPRLKTREERISSLPSIPGPGVPASKMRQLIKASNDERQSLGFGQEQFP